MITVSIAASGFGSFWWEGATLLKRAIAPFGIDLAIDDKAYDFINVLSVASGKNVLGITMPQFVDWAQRGFSVFANEQIPELRVVAALNLPVWLAAAVTRSSGIGSLAELAERRFPWNVVLPAPENLVGEYIDYIMAAHGLDRERILSWGGADLRPMLQKTQADRERLIRERGRDEMISITDELARTGAANGFFLYVNACSTWARDLTTLLDLRFLRFDEAALDAVNARWGGTKLALPERLFKGVDERLPAVGWRHHYIYGRADVPDDLVDAVLHALEDESILENAHGFSYSGFRPQLVSDVKLHPAAEAYYQRRRPRQGSEQRA